MFNERWVSRTESLAQGAVRVRKKLEEWSTTLRKPSCSTIVPESFPQSTRHKVSLDGAEISRVQRIRTGSSGRGRVWGGRRERNRVPQRPGHPDR